MRIFFLIFSLIIFRNVNGQWLADASVKDSISTTSYRPSYDTATIDSMTFFSNRYNDFQIKQWYYTNGQIEFEGFMVNGEFDGPYRSWYKNGQLQHFGYYKNGLPVGFYSSWYESGKIQSCGAFDKYNIADSIYKDYNTSRQFTFCDSFQIQSGKPPYTVYDSVICEYNILKSGKWTEYYESGQVKSEQHFNHGNRTGTWKIYNRSGQLIREELYEDNKLIQRIIK